MSDPIIEAAIDAAIHWTPSPYEIDREDRRAYGALVDEILKVVTPLIEAAYVRSRATIHVAAIRNAALEEAAVVAEDVDRDVARQSTSWSVGYFAQHIRGTAAAIRALKGSSAD